MSTRTLMELSLAATRMMGALRRWAAHSHRNEPFAATSDSTDSSEISAGRLTEWAGTGTHPASRRGRSDAAEPTAEQSLSREHNTNGTPHRSERVARDPCSLTPDRQQHGVQDADGDIGQEGASAHWHQRSNPRCVMHDRAFPATRLTLAKIECSDMGG